MMKTTGERARVVRRALIVPMLALTVLAGCHKSTPPPEDDFANDMTETPPAPVEAPREREEAPLPKLPPPDTNVADALPAEAAPSPDAQMLEDADATGLTSRATPPDVVTDPPTDPMDGAASNGLSGGH